MSRNIPNRLLRDLLDETSWTGQALADAINDQGMEIGLRLHYDRTSVAHWLSGSRPRPPVPELVAEALSRKLNRRIPASATGLAEPPGAGAAPPWWTWDAETQLVELSPNGSEPCGTETPYSLDALNVPSWSSLIAPRPPAPPGQAGAPSVGRPDVEAAATMLELFSAADAAHGGGCIRSAISAYLRRTIAPWLRADTSPSVRRELLVVAARLAYLCGSAWFDDELHGVAQRYYLAALRLAAEAGERHGYAIAVRGLSMQAHHLGHLRPAYHLAERAVRTAATKVPPHTCASLLGQLAVATAADGDRTAAIAHMRTAESHLEHATDATAPVGRYHHAAFFHQYAIVHLHTGDRPAAIQSLVRSLQLRTVEERLAHAITVAMLAELQLDEGRLDQACNTWHQFLDDYPLLRSGRVSAALASLRSRVRPFANVPVAHALDHRAAMLSLPSEQHARDHPRKEPAE